MDNRLQYINVYICVKNQLAHTSVTSSQKIKLINIHECRSFCTKRQNILSKNPPSRAVSFERNLYNLLARIKYLVICNHYLHTSLFCTLAQYTYSRTPQVTTNHAIMLTVHLCLTNTILHAVCFHEK
jgi:hypothetical protein